MEVLHDIEDILYGSVASRMDHGLYNNCTTFLDRKLMALDTSIAVTFMLIGLLFALKSYSFPGSVPTVASHPAALRQDMPGRPEGQIRLLVFMCLVFGAEIGYKISARKLIYLLYPCHIMTAVQILLLSVKVSRFSIGLLRLLIPYLYGALLALMFPDQDDRVEFPGMVLNFWIQHFMIFFVVPPYLIYIYGVESLEPFREWAWSCFSGVIFGLHHFFLLQPIGLLTGVNLNSMLCPFSGIPFNGPYYRLVAVFHQTLCLLTIGKIYSVILYYVLPRRDKLLKEE